MTNPDFSSLKVLVIDGNRYMRQVMRNVLGTFGIYSTADATDGKTALERLEEFKPDIIFTGYNLQPVDGILFTRIVRAGKAPVNRATPIVMVTSHTEAATVFKARDAGITEFLAKPVSSKLIGLRLRAVLEQPRPMIEAPNFYGPDRRRRELARGDMERRRKPYHYTVARRRSERRAERRE